MTKRVEKTFSVPAAISDESLQRANFDISRVYRGTAVAAIARAIEPFLGVVDTPGHRSTIRTYSITIMVEEGDD